METSYFICKHNHNCQFSGSKKCPFGAPIPKTVLDSLCGVFNPRFTIFCDHPKIRVGVLLVKTKHSHIEGCYNSIWTC